LEDWLVIVKVKVVAFFILHKLKHDRIQSLIRKKLGKNGERPKKNTPGKSEVLEV
jgi:hypothetical protein